jgi:hypothetical protein
MEDEKWFCTPVHLPGHASVELDNAPLGDDYDDNIEDYENSVFGTGNDTDDESEEMPPSQKDVAVLIDRAALPLPKVKTVRTANYTEIEDETYIKAWELVLLDAVTDIDQPGKRYWQRIEDMFFQNMSRLTMTPPRSAL